MKRFYSQSTGCCYLEGVHKGLPVDAVQISAERYDEVIGNPAPDKVRGHDDQGLPILIDAPAPTFDELSILERRWRDAELAKRQWLRDRHRDEQDLGRAATLTAAHFNQLLDYLQLLRDWPQSEGFPDSARRPATPVWLNEYKN